MHTLETGHLSVLVSSRYSRLRNAIRRLWTVRCVWVPRDGLESHPEYPRPVIPRIDSRLTVTLQ